MGVNPSECDGGQDDVEDFYFSRQEVWLVSLAYEGRRAQEGEYFCGRHCFCFSHLVNQFSPERLLGADEKTQGRAREVRGPEAGVSSQPTAFLALQPPERVRDGEEHEGDEAGEQQRPGIRPVHPVDPELAAEERGDHQRDEEHRDGRPDPAGQTQHADEQTASSDFRQAGRARGHFDHRDVHDGAEEPERKRVAGTSYIRLFTMFTVGHRTLLI